MHWTHRHLSSRGRPTSVLYGGLAGLLTLARRLPNTPLVFVWDGGGRTWRHELSPEYKANRKPNPDAEVVLQQLPVFREFLCGIGLREFCVPCWEADDVIGMLTTEIVRRPLFDGVVICSTDRDYYQLLGDRVVQLGSDGAIGPADVVREYGVHPRDWTKYRALTGDAGDNIIKARAGIGPKTAAYLLRDGLDPSLGAFEALPALVQRRCAAFRRVWERVHLNYQLSCIKCYWADAAGSLPSTRSFLREPVPESQYSRMLEFLAGYEMQEIIGRRFELWRLP